MKLSNKDFDGLVNRAIARIPRHIRQHLDNILITVQERPSPELREEMDLAPDETLFGIYQGIPLRERSMADPPLYPDTIHIFKEPLEELCGTQEELEKEIETTVVHEIAHFLGMSEERLAELGYG